MKDWKNVLLHPEVWVWKVECANMGDLNSAGGDLLASCASRCFEMSILRHDLGQGEGYIYFKTQKVA